MKLLRRNENIAYHAARLLILIRFCGSPQKNSHKKPGIEGRTLLAKLDFFLRYPMYLKKASDIFVKEGKIKENKFSNENFGLSSSHEVHSVESRMVRFLYGPWDDIYYLTLAYLVGKDLIFVEQERGVEIFRLTENGYEISEDIAKQSVYLDFVYRAKTIYTLFNKYKGNRLKDFIYNNFPEVVNRKIGVEI